MAPLTLIVIAMLGVQTLGCAARTQAPVARPAPLPPGALTRWEIGGPVEVIGAVLSAPETLADRLPAGTRYVTLAEFVTGVPEAVHHREHLRANPKHAGWVVSFFEIVRQERFVIDGRQPVWPEQGAAGVWMIPVIPSDPTGFEGIGLHVVEVWISDAPYARYMSAKGHHAIYGKATLIDAAQSWTGSLEASGVSAQVTCKPYGRTRSQGSGGQAFFPPQRNPAHLIRVSLAGHKQRECTGAWRMSGDHVLGRSIMIGQPWFEFGYTLVGGVYDWPPRARLDE